VKPGQRVRFRAVDVAEAHRLRRAWETSLAAAAGGPVTTAPAA
jgi:allophanate hydrolase subunit 2